MDTRAERRAARRFSERIEGMLDAASDQGAEDDLLDAARQLARLRELFGPPNQAFAQRLVAHIDARLVEQPRRRTAWRPRLAWGVVVALGLVVAGLFTSPGQAVMGRLMAVFQLGQAEVRVEPETAIVGRTFTATSEIALPGLPEAQATVSPRMLQAPAYLPDGYRLHRVSTSHFDELPAWAQPLFIDLTYRRETDEVIWELAFRQYFLASGGPGTISALTYPPEEFGTMREMEVNGHPAVLLAKQPSHPLHPDEQVLHLVWEGESAIFTLTAFDLSPEELIRIAESIVPYR